MPCISQKVIKEMPCHEVFQETENGPQRDCECMHMGSISRELELGTRALPENSTSILKRMFYILCLKERSMVVKSLMFVLLSYFFSKDHSDVTYDSAIVTWLYW